MRILPLALMVAAFLPLSAQAITIKTIHPSHKRPVKTKQASKLICCLCSTPPALWAA